MDTLYLAEWDPVTASAPVPVHVPAALPRRLAVKIQEKRQLKNYTPPPSPRLFFFKYIFGTLNKLKKKKRI